MIEIKTRIAVPLWPVGDSKSDSEAFLSGCPERCFSMVAWRECAVARIQTCPISCNDYALHTPRFLNTTPQPFYWSTN